MGIKTMKRGRDQFSKYKKIIVFSAAVFAILPRKVRYILLGFFRSFNGKFGMLIRYMIISSLVKKCGDNVSIHHSVVLLGLENMEIGNNVSIHPFTYIDGTGGLIIMDDVSIAHSSSILTTEHIFSDQKTPIKDQGITAISTIIENNCWIGAGSRVLAGAHIKTGCIIAAGAVLKCDTLSDSIYGGVPARKIKSRHEDILNG